MSITLLKKTALVANIPEQQAALDNIVPIDYIMDWFRARASKHGIKNRILVLQSDTGSGKSTAFPSILYKNFAMGPRAKNIAVTQPRILNAISIVKEQICGGPYYPWLKLGKNIGWQTGATQRKPAKGLVFMTIGVLV